MSSSFSKVSIDVLKRTHSIKTLQNHIIGAYIEIDQLQEQLNVQVNQFQQLLNQKVLIIHQLEQNNHGEN